MRMTASRLLQRRGETYVKSVVELMGHDWREAGREPYGLDGFIEVVRFGELTGQLIGVQVKSGRSYLASTRKQQDKSPRVPTKARFVRIEQDHLRYLRKCRVPVILIWFDPISGNAFWGEVNESTALTRMGVPNVFDRYAFREIARVADRWSLEYPTYRDPGKPHLPIKTTKGHGYELYKKYRMSGCYSPVLGYVQFTLRGWRHMTRKGSSVPRMRRNIELLGTAIEILEHQDLYHVCRVFMKGNVKHTLYKQSARIAYFHRTDAVVHVITERIGNGEPQFLSVYEDRQRVGGR